MTAATTTPLSEATARPSAEAPAFAVEVFPPKTDEGRARLLSAIRRLESLRPRYVSCTYGAGGSTRQRTIETVCQIRCETRVPPAAHITCVDAPRNEVDGVARRYWEAGIRHVIALRGDPPGGLDHRYEPHPQGYAYAPDLVAGLKRVADFDITVAAYPETHQEAPSPDADLEVLKRKIDNGATRAVTQFFFDPDVFLRFVDRARAAGIDVPIVPGIMPILNFQRTAEFARKCGATIPAWLIDLFDGLEDDPQTHQLVAATVAVDQCRYLYERGVREFHFYSLNRAELTLTVCCRLGVRPAPRSLVH